MSIEFWSISRGGVKELYQIYGNGQAPSSDKLDRLVTEIGLALDDTLEEVVFLATKEQRKELI